jgi:predicted dehydrogenase
MLLGERSGETQAVSTADGTETRTYPPVDLYRAEVEDFCRHLRGEPLVGTSLREAAATTELLLAIDEAAHTP